MVRRASPATSSDKAWRVPRTWKSVQNRAILSVSAGSRTNGDTDNPTPRRFEEVGRGAKSAVARGPPRGVKPCSTAHQTPAVVSPAPQNRRFRAPEPADGFRVVLAARTRRTPFRPFPPASVFAVVIGSFRQVGREYMLGADAGGGKPFDLPSAQDPRPGATRSLAPDRHVALSRRGSGIGWRGGFRGFPPSPVPESRPVSVTAANGTPSRG